MWLAIVLFITLILSFTLMGLQFAAPKDMGVDEASENPDLPDQPVTASPERLHAPPADLPAPSAPFPHQVPPKEPPIFRQP